MNSKLKRYEIDRRETDEIIGEAPSWIIFWGTTIISICFSILLFITSLVEFPEKMEFPVVSTLAPHGLDSAQAIIFVGNLSQVQASKLVKGQSIDILIGKNEATIKGVVKSLKRNTKYTDLAIVQISPLEGSMIHLEPELFGTAIFTFRAQSILEKLTHSM